MEPQSNAKSSTHARGTVRRFSVILVAYLAGMGCTPRCEENCVKVLDCGLDSTRVSYEECVLSCKLQESLYQTWKDQAKIDAFKAHKRCIGKSTCDEIEAGVCYDEDLFIADNSSADDAL